MVWCNLHVFKISSLDFVLSCFLVYSMNPKVNTLAVVAGMKKTNDHAEPTQVER